MSRQITTAITAISKITDQTPNRAAALVVIHGDELGKKFDFTTSKLVVGRSSKCSISLDQDSVSRQHARFNCDRGRVTLSDLKSTNGTFVNDEQITADMKLRNGDLIKIGRTIFKFIASNNIEAAYHDEVYRLTTMDGLTQVFNRRYFEDTIERELARCKRHGRSLSLVLLDVDHFKKINDQHGHLAGDAVLKEVATTLRRRIRREDILSRYGGEEFALLLPEIDLKHALLMAEKTRKLVEKHEFVFDKTDISVTISGGVASLTRRLDDPKELVQRADEKLYEAKKSGRNRIC